MKLFLLSILLSTVLPAAEVNIAFEKYKLPNGLRVLLAPDPSVPVVTVYLVYGVGSRSEEKGRSGFAHLFEHMMFQGSANAPKGMHFQTVEANGGNLNGSTHPDYTDYYETLPSNKLAVALWLEADRMRSLAITKENLDNQKEAVKQERRLSVDNQPYAKAIVEDFPALAFRNWSNSHSSIGSFEDLNAATVEDVSKFFATHYAPNNAVLAIAGDIKPAEAKKLIAEYFGSIKAQPQPKPPDLTEPAQTEPRSQVFRDPLARVPAIILSYPGPARRSPDYYSLAMLDIVLTGGESSRLYQAMVKGTQSVLGVEANLGWPYQQAFDYKDPNVYAVNFTYNPAVDGKKVTAEFVAEIEKLKETLIDAKELERARNTLRSVRVRSLQSSMSRANLLALYELLDGKPELINTELAEFLKVTPEQIRAAARKYIVPSKLTAFDIVPAPQKEEKK
ncbi:MAG: pitrilysin family protein [Bryobacteraceae bacterium]